MLQIIYQYVSNGGCQSGHFECDELVNGYNVGNKRIIQSAQGALQIIKQWNMLSTACTKMQHYDGPQD